MNRLFRLLGCKVWVVLVAFACGGSVWALPPTLTVTPAVITNDYVGTISLTISNLSPGQKIIVERYLDRNGNGIIDPGQDVLEQRFAVIDGVLPFLGGVRNINVPGDEDGVTNGQIRVALNYPSLNEVLDHIAAKYLFRIVDPAGVLPSVTANFSVVQKTYPQGVQGKIVAAGSGQPLTNALVVLVPQTGNDGVGVLVDSNGNFSISSFPGSFAVLALQNGFVSDQSAALVTISSNSFASVNLTNRAAAVGLAGSITDSGTGKGLAGIFIQASDTNNLFTIGFTDTNGSYYLPVTASQWKVKVNADSGIEQNGYVALQNNSIKANTFSGSVSNLNLQFQKGTSLIFGHVKDTFSKAVAALAVTAQDSNYTYDCRGRSISDGSYAVAVLAGNWSVGPSSDELSVNGWLGQSTNVSVTNSQALLQDVVIQRPTAHLRGHVVDSSGSPVGNIAMVVFLQTGTGPNSINLNLQTVADGSFDVGVFAGNWNVGLECSSAAARGLVVPSITVSVTNGVDQNNLVLVAPAVTAYIDGTITDKNGNPVSVQAYAALNINGTNYSACGANAGSSFQLPVFSGTWQVGISGDLTSLGYDNPLNQTVTVNTGTVTANITLYPPGQNPPLLSGPGYYNGQFQLRLTGDSGRMYRIDTTTNLTNPAGWTTLVTNTASGGFFNFSDPNAKIGPPRFYRAVLVQ